MVNTVGSYENKNWQKRWIPIKKNLTISSAQRSFIIGSLLGDGTMWLGDGAVNANFKVEQGLVQKEYVFWKYEILKSLVFTEPKLSFRYDSNGKRYERSWWFRTIRHPLLTEIFRRFYLRDGFRCGRKIVPKDIEKDLNPLALAVWIMDDGSYSQKKIDISTYSFSLEEVKFLQKVMRHRFGIKMLFFRDREKGYRMYANVEESKKLIQTICPYIIPTMMYKIGSRNPVTTSRRSSGELSVTG